jgi:hypothetical protein
VKPNDVCWAKECMPKRKNKMGQAHMAEEEEGGLMLVEADACPTKF